MHSWVVVLPCAAQGSRRDRLEDWGQAAGFVKLAQHAVTCGRVRDVDQLPLADLDFMTVMFSHYAWQIFVGAKTLLLHGGVEDRRKKLSVTCVSSGNPRIVSEFEDIDGTQDEAAWQFLGNLEIKLERVAARGFDGCRATSVVPNKLVKGRVWIERQPIKKHGEIDGRCGGFRFPLR